MWPRCSKDLPRRSHHGNRRLRCGHRAFCASVSRNVTLKSRHPTHNPVVDYNYFSDPLDLLVLSEGCQLANEIVTAGAGTKDVVTGAWPRNLTHHTYTSRQERVTYIRSMVDIYEMLPCPPCLYKGDFVKTSRFLGYHPAGSCKMGRSNDPMAVLMSTYLSAV